MSSNTPASFKAAIEAILFASGEPVQESRLVEVLGISRSAVREQVHLLIEAYQKPHHGIAIVALGDCYQMCTKTAHHNVITQALLLKRNAPLSAAAIEVLAIIAYNQPVTKSFVEQVRGVDSSYLVSSLVEKGLLAEAGRLEVPGRPIAYETTKQFLRSFGLSSLDKLPSLPSETGQVTIT